LYHGFVKKKPIRIVPVLFLGIAALPGLLSGVGNPEQSRLAIVVLPLYYLIAYGFYNLFIICRSRPQIIARSALTALLGTAALFTLAYQIHNFFSYNRIDRRENIIAVKDYISGGMTENADAVIAYHEFANLRVYSYTIFRWLGGADMEQNMKDGRVILVRYSNEDKLRQMIKDRELYVFITQQDEVAIQIFPELSGYVREEWQHFTLYRRE
jgi:hypothetical protein